MYCIRPFLYDIINVSLRFRQCYFMQCIGYIANCIGAHLIWLRNGTNTVRNTGDSRYVGERGGSVVECRTPEREVRGSRPTAAVLCPWARHFTPRKYWLITQEAMAPSRYDWKIVDWDVKPQHNQPTNQSRYVDFAYLDTITYVEVIFHSQHFFSIYLCISTPSMSKTVNMKQRVSRADFSCPRRIFYYICYVLCRSQKSALTRVPYCLFWLCTCITWSAKIFNQKSKTIKVIYPLSIEQVILSFSAVKSMVVLIRNHTQYR